MTSADTTPPPTAKGHGEKPSGGAPARDEVPAGGTPGPAAAPAQEPPASEQAGATDPASAGEPQVKPRRAVPRLQRPNPVRDMAISLGVLIVPLLILMAFCRPHESDVATIDPSGTYRAAAAEAKFPVRKPAGLPSGWRSTNAAIERAAGGGLTLRVSYITPSTEFIQVIQSDVPAEVLIPKEVGSGKTDGRIEIGTVSWQRYAGRKEGESALVLLDPKVTVMVSGDAPMGELTAFAALLR